MLINFSGEIARNYVWRHLQAATGLATFIKQSSISDCFAIVPDSANVDATANPDYSLNVSMGESGACLLDWFENKSKFTTLLLQISHATYHDWDLHNHDSPAEPYMDCSFQFLDQICFRIVKPGNIDLKKVERLSPTTLNVYYVYREHGTERFMPPRPRMQISHSEAETLMDSVYAVVVPAFDHEAWIVAITHP